VGIQSDALDSCPTTAWHGAVPASHALGRAGKPHCALCEGRQTLAVGQALQGAAWAGTHPEAAGTGQAPEQALAVPGTSLASFPNALMPGWAVRRRTCGSCLPAAAVPATGPALPGAACPRRTARPGRPLPGAAAGWWDAMAELPFARERALGPPQVRWGERAACSEGSQGARQHSVSNG